LRVGVHTSIAGGLENAAHHARRIGCDTFQMFSANPRGWKAQEPSPDDYERFRSARAKHGLRPVVIHDNYLINLAASDKIIREKSIAAFRREIERALALGADFLVTHPGSAKGGTPVQAIETCAESLKVAARGLLLDGLRVLIENTAGQGAVIGRTFEEVAEIITRAEGELPMGACIDTAHSFEAGYPIHTAEGLRETVKQLEVTVGIKRLRVIHSNGLQLARRPARAHRQGFHRQGRLPKNRTASQATVDPVYLRNAT
jgi:deoxyribonuclease-4